MYIHKDLPAIPCQEMVDMEIEDSMWASVKLNDKDTLLAGIVSGPRNLAMRAIST